MIASLLARFIGAKAAGVVADLLPFLLIAGLVWWVQGMRADLRDTRAALAAETKARERDIAGLTALAEGSAKAAADSRKDQAIIAETIDASHPAPVSPSLAAALARMRAADGGEHAAPAAGR